MTVRLTTNQRATFRRAYRDAYSASNNYATLDALYTKYEELYGVSRDILLEIVTEDHLRNRAQYLALHAARELQKKQRRKAHQQTRKPERGQPKHKDNPAAQAKREAKVKRRAAFEAKAAAQREAERKRAVTNPQYYTRATYCPQCHRDLGCEFMPPHDDRPNHKCKGSGKFGVTKATADRKPREESSGRGSSVRTVGGGLPSLGKRHR